MRFALLVHDAPFASQASSTALRFARAALGAGHQIRRVFFFHEGVAAANGLAVTEPDELSPSKAWVTLAQEHDLELAACIATALKRGVVDADAQIRYDLPGASLHPAFTLVGLGQLVEAMADCDRLVTFA